MRDRQTGSIWTHYDGAALVGPMADAEVRLPILTTIHTTWAEWRSLHPDTLVMDEDTDSRSAYREHVPGVSGMPAEFPRTILHTDDRLPGSEFVLGAGAGDQFRAYPLAGFPDGLSATADVLGGHPIVVFADPGSHFALAYSAVLDGESLDFEVVDGAIRDASGSTWSIEGEAVDGPLAGRGLDFVTGFVTEWYGWVAYYPSTTIYGLDA